MNNYLITISAYEFKISNTEDTMVFQGAKFDHRLDTISIAKMIRSDIKQAVKDGKFPEGLKIVIRTERFSAGTSIDVTITEVPAGTAIQVDGKPTIQALVWIEAIRDLVLAYHSEGADKVGDHLLPNFYYRIQIHRKVGV